MIYGTFGLHADTSSGRAILRGRSVRCHVVLVMLLLLFLLLRLMLVVIVVYVCCKYYYKYL